jgi:hypothetical protein
MGRDGAERRDAVAGEDDGKFPGSGCNRPGYAAHQLERGADLGAPCTGGKLDPSDFNAVTLSRDHSLDARLEQPLRPGTHPLAPVAGVVRHDQELNIHREKLSLIRAPVWKADRMDWS